MKTSGGLHAAESTGSVRIAAASDPFDVFRIGVFNLYQGVISR